uniref:Uncharacterized protein n=1 Tax=Edwardsiella tarda TaxID=636 RepID=A0A2H5CQ82_EDWTA|nr:hypothetical protein [Edwardsiella tarda]AUH26719.1 hypothetical protein [Edwardsiella tarda]
MAGAKTITLNQYDDLSDVLTQLDYTHAMTSLIIEQKDYAKLPPHQQTALLALSVFADEARQKLVGILEKEL